MVIAPALGDLHEHVFQRSGSAAELRHAETGYDHVAQEVGFGVGVATVWNNHQLAVDSRSNTPSRRASHSARRAAIATAGDPGREATVYLAAGAWPAPRWISSTVPIASSRPCSMMPTGRTSRPVR